MALDHKTAKSGWRRLQHAMGCCIRLSRTQGACYTNDADRDMEAMKNAILFRYNDDAFERCDLHRIA